MTAKIKGIPEATESSGLTACSWWDEGSAWDGWSGGEGNLLSSPLYEVKPLNPVAYTGAAALLLFVAFAASYVPAQRAMRVDPVTALKYE